jgi:hypothetical protein
VESTQITGHTDAVRHVTFSRDAHVSYLASTSNDSTIKLWNIHDQNIIRTLHSHSNNVRVCDISPFDIDFIASGSDDLTMKLFDTKSSYPVIHSFTESTSPIADVSFHPTVSHYVGNCSTDGTIRIYDTRTYETLMEWNHEGGLSSISFHPNGRFLLSAGHDKTCKIWDLQRGLAMYTLEGHKGPLTSVSFSPRGDFFATGGSDNLVMLWKTNFDAYITETTDNSETHLLHDASVNVVDQINSTVDEGVSSIGHLSLSGEASRVKIDYDSEFANSNKSSLNNRYSDFNKIQLEYVNRTSPSISTISRISSSPVTIGDNKRPEFHHYHHHEEIHSHILPDNMHKFPKNAVSGDDIAQMIREKQFEVKRSRKDIEDIEREEELRVLKEDSVRDKHLLDDLRRQIDVERHTIEELRKITVDQQKTIESSTKSKQAKSGPRKKTLQEQQYEQAISDSYEVSQSEVGISSKQLKETLDLVLQQMATLAAKVSNMEEVVLRTEGRVGVIETVITEIERLDYDSQTGTDRVERNAGEYYSLASDNRHDKTNDSIELSSDASKPYDPVLEPVQHSKSYFDTEEGRSSLTSEQQRRLRLFQEQRDVLSPRAHNKLSQSYYSSSVQSGTEYNQAPRKAHSTLQAQTPLPRQPIPNNEAAQVTLYSPIEHRFTSPPRTTRTTIITEHPFSGDEDEQVEEESIIHETYIEQDLYPTTVTHEEDYVVHQHNNIQSSPRASVQRHFVTTTTPANTTTTRHQIFQQTIPPPRTSPTKRTTIIQEAM